MAVDLARELSGDEDALLAALLQIHRAKAQRARQADPEGGYGRILAHFEERGHRLRGEKVVTSEIVERLFASTKVLAKQGPQRELELVGRAGTSAAGRFHVTNRSSESARFELVVGDALDHGPRPAISFTPAQGELGAGASILVRVEANLRSLRAGDRTTVPVECRWRRGRDRMWLVVSVDDDGEGAR
jgi:hypothetical protein